MYCHPAYLTYMQSTSCEMLGWIKFKVDSRLPGEISITSNKSDDATLMAESEEELKSSSQSLDESERGEQEVLATSCEELTP